MKLPNLINGTVLLLLEISSEKKIAHDHIIKKMTKYWPVSLFFFDKSLCTFWNKNLTFRLMANLKTCRSFDEIELTTWAVFKAHKTFMT